MTPPGYSIAVVRRGAGLVGLEVLARDAGLHPDVVRRLFRLGLIEQRGGTTIAPLFAPESAAVLARSMRLRRDLGLNYAGAVLACELLARIEDLEDRLRRAAAQRDNEGMTWTRTG